ncbi:MAG TPA: glycosyltransferase family 4 protein [Patescibacteria group bacterium]|nr:glycosyltransferase family 4 protein [Patescibacteria group bacterium]
METDTGEINVISLGTDRLLWQPGSKIRRRLEVIAEPLGSYSVFVMSKAFKTKPMARVGKLKIRDFPVLSPFTFFSFLAFVARAKVRGPVILTAQDPFFCGFLVALAAHICHMPYELQLHTDPYSPMFQTGTVRRKLELAIANFLLPRAPIVRVVSKRVEEALYARGISHTYHLPVYTELDARPRDSKDFEYEFTFLSVGRFESEKKFDLLISAFQEAQEEMPNAGLVLEGDGSQAAFLRSLVKPNDRIQFYPWEMDVVPYYQSADVYVLSSMFEGYAMAPLEAAANGCAVVMTDVGMAGEVLKHEESALVVPPGDKEALKNAMLRIYKDNELRSKLKENAKAVTQNLASLSQVREAQIQAWQKVLALH